MTPEETPAEFVRMHNEMARLKREAMDHMNASRRINVPHAPHRLLDSMSGALRLMTERMCCLYEATWIAVHGLDENERFDNWHTAAVEEVRAELQGAYLVLLLAKWMNGERT